MAVMILKDIKHAVKSWIMWLCVAVGAGLAIFTLYSNEYLYNMRVSELGSMTAFIHATAFAPGSIFQLCAPLLCIMPYALSHLDNMKSRYINNILVRTKCSTYYIQKFISTCTIGAIYYVFTYLIIIVLCCIISPCPSVRIVLTPITPFVVTYQKSLAKFILVYMVHSMVFGATFNAFALGASSVFQNRYVSLAVPYVLYHTAMLIAWLFPKTMVYDVVQFIPYESFNIQVEHLWTIVYRHSVVLILGICLYLVGIYRYRVKCVTYH